MTDLKTPCECQSMTSMMLEAELLKAMAENVDLQSGNERLRYACTLEFGDVQKLDAENQRLKAENERLKKESFVGLLEAVVAALKKEGGRE